MLNVGQRGGNRIGNWGEKELWLDGKGLNMGSRQQCAA